MNDLEKALESAKEIEAEFNELDRIPEKRKMRFDDNNVGANSSITPPGLWLKRNVKPELTAEELSLARIALQARGDELPDEYESRWQDLAGKIRRYTMTSGGSATGAELTDTILWTQLLSDVVKSTEVASLFSPFIDMPTGKMELSELGDAIFYKPAGEGQAVTATDLATAKRTFNAYVLKAQVDVSDELDEDAIVAMIPALRAKLIQNAKEAIDDVILNADTTTDTTNINSEGTALDASSRYLIGFDGLIHYCLKEVTGQGEDLAAAPSVAKMNVLLNLLGKYGVKPEQVAFICDIWTWGVLRGVSEFLTADKYGESATLKTGQVPTPFGSPMVVSAQIAKSDATGNVDDTAGDNVKGRLLVVNRSMWKVGFKRNVRIATERNEAKGLTSIIASLRIALQCFGDRSTATYCHTALGYDGTV